jgi:pimeloyl-ACP methyl ester carboxylesterase
MKKIILVIIAWFFGLEMFSQSITGSWNGVLDYGTGNMRLVFHIAEKDGVYITTWDSPDEGVKNLKTTNTILKNKTLTINIARIFAVFKGKVKKHSIEGTFTQNGKTFPLILTRGTVEINRPQDPQPPYPYHSEEVYFENEQAGIRLAGTFTRPKEGNKFPCAILLSGSGAQNRDEEIYNHRPFLVLADYLTRAGIAVLRYDDRGVGQSQGVYQTASIHDFSIDALAAVTYLKTRKDIDTNQIGFIGHSEGGSIAIIASAENKDIAFVVSMAGVAIKGDSLLALQRHALAKASGASDEDIAKNEALVKQMYALVEKHTADSVFRFPEKFVDEIIPKAMKKTPTARVFYKNQLAVLASPEIYSISLYDPKADLQKILCPVFAVNGEKDLQVLPDVNLENFEKWLSDKVVTKKYPDLNHLFQHAHTGLTDEYAKTEETLSEDVLADITKWIKMITK